MSSFKIISQEVIPQAIGDTSDVQLCNLGTRVRAVDTASTAYGEAEFIYAIGVASTVVGSVALINSDSYQTSLAVTTNKGQLGLAMSINTAGRYGWYQLEGKGVADVAAGFADNATCYLTATPGVIDDAAVAGDLIIGIKGASAINTPATGLAEVELDNPYVTEASGVTLGDLGVSASAGDINAITNFEETVEATTSEVTIKTAKTFNVTDNSGFKIAGTAVSSTAAELNILDGVTATTSEINQFCDQSANTEVVTTTNILTASESGKTLILDSATAFVTTLPAIAAGLRFNFYCGATGVTGGNHTIVPNAANDNTIFGSAEVAGAVVAASAEGSINLIADKFIAGDHISLFCDGTNWYVQGSAVTSAGITFTT